MSICCWQFTGAAVATMNPFQEHMRNMVENSGICEELFTASKQGGTPMMVAMIDIDFFKKINDTYGHEGGDVALKHLSGLLQEIIGKEHLLARFGGEEFCILSKGCELETAGAFFEEIRNRVETSSIVYNKQTISFTISVGVAYHHHGPLQEMINHADEMLYQAKDSGRNQVVIPSLERQF